MSEGMSNRTMERMRVLEESLNTAHDKINSLEMALYFAKKQEKELQEKISKYESLLSSPLNSL
jgi:predicted  nucleic acid-binding Zn-ribbon protein